MTDPAPSKVKVVVRIRPFVAKEANKRCVMVSQSEKSSIELRQSPHAPALSYGFDGAYDSDSQQEQLFHNEIEPMIGSVFKGIHTTIFAYGITGAGKTFTMQGSDEQPGLIPRVARKVVSLAREHTVAAAAKGVAGGKCSVTVSYLEIYNEKVFDLLRPKAKDLPIREDTNKNILIPDLAQLPVRTYEDFANTYAEGCKNRTVAPTSLNAHSSRSHAVLILTIKHRDGKRKYVGKLHLIDLAGSEDNRRTDNIGIRMTESSNINKSLFVLGKVVNALNDGSSRVPYRDSKLTRLLQDSLGGRSYGVMIANVSPSVNHYQDTFNTLNFASKSRQIINKPVVNTVDDEASRKALLEEYLELKKRMPGAAGKENRNASNANARRGIKDRAGGGDGQKIDVSDLEAFIAQKTKEVLEQRIKDMFSGEEVLKSKMENENFRMLKELERRLVETNKRHLEECFDDDEDDELNYNSLSANVNVDVESGCAGHGDAKALLLTPFTKVTTGVDMARRAKKYAKRGQYDRAIRYYNRLLRVMPEKEPFIRKKIAKLEERKRTEAASVTTPADTLRERRTKRNDTSTPFQPSSEEDLTSLMKSLSLSDGGRAQAGPVKKLSFDDCDVNATPASRSSSSSSKRSSVRSKAGTEQKRRQQTPGAAKLTTTTGSRLGSAQSRVASVRPKQGSQVVERSASREKRPRGTSKAVVPETSLRHKPSRSPKALEAEVEVPEEEAVVMDEPTGACEEDEAVDGGQVETSEGEDDEEEEEDDERAVGKKSKTSGTRHRHSSESEDDEDDSEADGDYLDSKAHGAHKTVRSAVVSYDDSDDDDEASPGGHDTNEQREEDVLHVVNTGTLKDLLELHGIGKKRAEAIIDNRPFAKLAELKKIGLGDKLFESFMKRNVWEAV